MPIVVIVYQAGCDRQAKQAADDLEAALGAHVTAETVPAESASTWPAAPAWDDLLVVMYSNAALFPAKANAFIDQYARDRSGHGQVLPVATDPTPPQRKPPQVVAGIKALPYGADAQGKDGLFARRVAAMLALRLQGRDATIFLSHRSTDGAAIAAQLHEHFLSLGYRPFLDEAKELDGETVILPGNPVQQEIDARLESANLLLLIDTPDVLGSKWIKHEVDTAVSFMLPSLPIVFRSTADRDRGPRFRALRDLQRFEELTLPPMGHTPPLTSVELTQITLAAERYLCEIFQRKCRVPFIVEKEFVAKGFSWKVLDKRLFMYRSSKVRTPRLTTNVLSHCSIFHRVYGPALTRFCKFLDESEHANHSLFLYDGELLPESELIDIMQHAGDSSVIVLHHQELAELIHSNFTVLGK